MARSRRGQRKRASPARTMQRKQAVREREKRDDDRQPPAQEDREFEMVRAQLDRFDAKRWEAAMEQKRAMPRVTRTLADPGPAMFGRAGSSVPGIFLPDNAQEANVRAWSKPPAYGSFGFVGAFAIVASKASRDEGDTWSAYDDLLPNAAVQQLYWTSGSLYAVTHGRGIWRRTPC